MRRLISATGLLGATLAIGLVLFAGSPIAAGPTPRFAPSTWDVVFPDTAVGSLSAPQILTITNSGKGAETFSKIEIGGPNPGDFQVTEDYCTGTTLATSQGCLVKLVFAPTAHGTRVAKLKFTDNTTCPDFVHLAGGGDAAANRTAKAHAASCTPGVFVAPSTTVVSAPSSNPPAACTSKRRFKVSFKAPKGRTFRSLSAKLGKRTFKVTRGATKSVVDVDLRGLDHGKFTMKVSGKLSPNGSYARQRKYVTCTASKSG